MIRPFLYAVADAHYFKAYSGAFLGSAWSHGHKADVFFDRKAAGDNDFQERARYAALRFIRLPKLLKKMPAILVLDVDTIIQRPIEIEDEYDLGLYLRPWKPTPKTKTMAGMFYCTDRAMEFAEAVAKASAEPGPYWGRDQAILWNTYEAMKDRFRVKVFGPDDMGQEPGCAAPVFTRGRHKEQAAAFAEAAQQWSVPA